MDRLLDNKAWGKVQNLILYLSEIGTNQKYSGRRLLRFAKSNYNDIGKGATMTIDSVTGVLLGSVLSSAVVRDLFTTIADKRIAETAALKEANPEAGQQLKALENADLISPSSTGQKYFVTAKGLKVARDLQKLPIG